MGGSVGRRPGSNLAVQRVELMADVRSPDQLGDGRIKPGLRAVAPGYCGAKTARGGSCKNPAGYRTEHPGWGHCQLHFGSSPSGKESAAKQRTRAIATRARLNLGFPDVNVTPEQALTAEINRSFGMIAWIQRELASWEITDAGMVKVPLAPDTYIEVPLLLAMTGGHPATAGVFEAYRGECAHLARVAKMGVDANLVDRSLKIDEKRVDLLNSVLTRIITDLGHDPQDNDVRRVVSRRLREVAS